MHRFPPAGPSGFSSPPSSVLSMHSDSSSPPPRSVALRLAVPPARLFASLPPVMDVTSGGPGAVCSAMHLTACLKKVGGTRPPRFLGNPCAHAPLFDPGGPITPRLYRCNQYCLPLRKRRRLRNQFHSVALSRGSRTPCVRFADRVTPSPRNTRFQLVANLCWVRTLTHWVTQEGFSYVFPFT